MPETADNRLIRPLALLTTAATLLLIFMGGLVTSHGAGMSVPDWPNSYGYNMFAFPVSQWREGVFYEHTHRLMGSLVGFTSLLMFLHAWGYPKNFKLLGSFGLTVIGLTSILGVWAAVAPHGSFTVAAVAKYGFELVVLIVGLCVYGWFCRKPDERRWIRGLSLAVLLSVLFQGLLGGMRVVLVNLDLAIVHACVAQAFLCLVALLTLLSATSKYAKRSHGEVAEATLENGERSHGRVTQVGTPTCDVAATTTRTTDWVTNLCHPGNPIETKMAKRSQLDVSPMLATFAGITFLVIFAQLIVGATMRHFQAGLAIPDLPLAYHHWLPPTDPQQLKAANVERAFGEFGVPLPAVTLGQIWLHFGHRCGALLVTILLGGTVVWTLLKTSNRALRQLAWTLVALLLLQLTLGVLTVLWRKPADIASTHVAVGAATLMTTFVLYIRLRGVSRSARVVDVSPSFTFELSPVSA